MNKNIQVIELLIDPYDYRRWQCMASTLCLSVSEYIRRCTNAHTIILEYDSFDIVHGSQNSSGKEEEDNS